MVRSRVLAIMAMLLALGAWAACADAPPTPSGILGRYALVLLGGTRLPYASAPHDPSGPFVRPVEVACVDSTFSQSLELHSGGALTLSTEQGTYCDDGRPPQARQASITGSYSLVGDSLYVSLHMTDAVGAAELRMQGMRRGDTLRFDEPVRTVDAPDGNGQTLPTFYVKIQ